MDRFSLQLLSPNLWVWVALVLPALCLAFWAYFGLLAPLTRPARGLLWGLRAAAFVIVLFALWQPVVTLVVPESGRPNLAVLLDTSGSMDLPSTAGMARSRERDQVFATLQDELKGDFGLRAYAFDQTISPLQSSAGDSSAGAPATSIGGAIEQILVRADSDPVSGIIVVSDGVNTAGRDPVRMARGSPVPIFTVAVGRDQPVTDLEIRKLQSNARAFAGEPLPLRLVLSTHGLADQTANIEVRERGELVLQRSVTLAGGRGLEQEVSLELTPRQAGLRLYDVQVSVDGDSIAQNNLRQVAVDVLERKTQVLCVSDAIDWDFGFLRRAFEADTTLAYRYVVQTQPGTFRNYGVAGLDGLPETATALREYAAVVLVVTGRLDLPSAFYEGLAGFVRGGGGLFVVGAPDQADAFAAAPGFARVLPATLERDPRTRDIALSVETTREALRHPLTALRDNPSETARIFAALPPIGRPRTGLSVKPQARELLRYRGGADLPMLTAGFADRGKVVWVHARGLWKWRLNAGTGDVPSRVYDEFVLGVVRWIAEPAIRDRFQVEPGRRVYAAGEPTHFVASLWDEAFRPIEAADILVTVVDAADTASAGLQELTLVPSDEAGQFRAGGAALPPGEYRYRARAVDPESGTELHEASGTFWVESMGPEFARTGIDRESLAQIAAQSGGLAVDRASLRDLVSSIPEAVRRIGRVEEIELWNHWVLFALFVLVLSTEWFLRRRRGLA